MTIALWCLLIAGLLVVLSKAPAMSIMSREPQGYDNHNPRAQQARLEGAGARAIAAHQNTLEAFPLFAAGVLVAQMFAPEHLLTQSLAVLFILSRVVYIWLYVRDFSTVRSLVWSVGYLASLALLLAPLYATV
ncbi:MAG: MAPEG family protein [Saccharospirillum sp.]